MKQTYLMMIVGAVFFLVLSVGGETRANTTASVACAEPVCKEYCIDKGTGQPECITVCECVDNPS